RFWHKFLYDIGAVSCPEPYVKRTSHGMILGENGEKMSKSRGNVINPDDIVNELGADAFRLYEMFMGAFDQAIPWSTKGARGCYRFLERVWKLQEIVTDEEEISQALKANVHQTIKKVSEDYERMKFNTGIAAMMALVNDIYANGSLSRGDLRALLLLLNPVAPHMTEEMWESLRLSDKMMYEETWPEYDEAAMVKDEIELAVQICGKLKGRITVPTAYDAAQIEAFALADEKIQGYIDGKTVRKVIVVPGKIVNIVVG
ncbi:MAG: class I tRNA ligase family protein, partial [Clostridia bacterium]|nr:class I tRNA ligase family protein [Clostridia bacterium]